MKRIKWFVLLLVMASSVGGFADSCVCFSATVANFFFGANGGEGDNAGLSLIGPGVNVGGGGGTPVDSWLGSNPNFGFVAGSIGGGSAEVDFDEGMFGTLGPYNSNNSIFSTSCCTSVNAGTFTFPTNGKNFTVRLPAGICCIGGTLTTPTGSVLTLNVNIPSGYLTSYMGFREFHGRRPLLFRSRNFHHSSRPISLALVGTGLVAIFGSLRRRLKV
jgi:hypothetical protein